MHESMKEQICNFGIIGLTSLRDEETRPNVTAARSCAVGAIWHMLSLQWIAVVFLHT